MADKGNELETDVPTAQKAAQITDKLISDRKVRRGRKNQFAEDVGKTVVDTAREMIEANKDSVTGLLLNTVVRKNVAERLQQGQHGMMVILDMVGLKHLNTFSHPAGDSGLRTVASSLNEFGFSELGRKGDEFYGFVSNMSEFEFRLKFGEFISIRHATDRLIEPMTGTHLLTYWDCGHIEAAKDLDGLVDRLDGRVEEVKGKVASRVLQMIDSQPQDQRPELMMLYFNQKVRAKPGEIAQFANNLDERLRQQYGINGRRNVINEESLEKISEDLKHKFNEFQEKALRELKLL